MLWGLVYGVSGLMGETPGNPHPASTSRGRGQEAPSVSQRLCSLDSAAPGPGTPSLRHVSMEFLLF